ncbi:MAG: ATP-dependent sacrificial sulfur transferase LarE [candidate division Zixibacteria bacterium]|nr:ATP-dependent sacrificial sulfur transferase LarE [candidate division Zixibacteria bacterium]
MNSKKENKLTEIIKELDSAVIGLSGGVDSTLITKFCIDCLGPENVWAATGDSKSIPAEELEYCRKIADELNLPEGHFKLIATDELDNPDYAANPENRCYFCKQELFGKLAEYAKEVGAKHIVDGSNASDLNDYRPGRRAGKELQVRSPFAEAGINKDDIRTLAKKLGLPNWDKPSMPCLSSRIPYNSPVTPEKLEQIAAAEKYLRELGFKQFRVRHHGQIARLEIDDFNLILKNGLRNKINSELKKLGFDYIAIDLGGFRSGNLNINIR